MENKTQPSTWERSITRRFLRWLFSPRVIRRAIIVLAWAVTIIALFYGIAKWRGRSAWSAYRQDYESRVASLDFQTYIPKAVADSENFAATPFVQSFFASSTNFLFDNDDFMHAGDRLQDPKKGSPLARARHFMDLAAWQKAFEEVHRNAAQTHDRLPPGKLDAASRSNAAPAVLDGLKDDEAVLGELQAVSGRREARYPVVYNLQDPWSILLPHLAKIKQACMRLQLRACAELALGQGDKGFDDTRLLIHMTDSLKSEPSIISQLVRMACIQAAMQPVWEGIAEQRWSDEQLQQIQSELVRNNILADLEKSEHAERAAGVLTVDLLKKRGFGWLGDIMNTSPGLLGNKEALNLVGWLIPAGWYDQEKLQFCLVSERQIKGTVDVSGKRVYPREIALHTDDFSMMTMTNAWQAILHHQFMARLLSPALDKLSSKAAMAQTATDEAAIACALERYRLADGQFPDSLSALVPRWMAQLPNDIISGESYKYRRTADGSFILYSVGWNEKDDGGTPGKTMFDTAEGDWIW